MIRAVIDDPLAKSHSGCGDRTNSMGERRAVLAWVFVDLSPGDPDARRRLTPLELDPHVDDCVPCIADRRPITALTLVVQKRTFHRRARRPRPELPPEQVAWPQPCAWSTTVLSENRGAERRTCLGSFFRRCVGTASSNLPGLAAPGVVLRVQANPWTTIRQDHRQLSDNEWHPTIGMPTQIGPGSDCEACCGMPQSLVDTAFVAVGGSAPPFCGR